MGYTGRSYEIPFRFPAYGVMCQSECNCSKDHCNYVSGCGGKLYFLQQHSDIRREKLDASMIPLISCLCVFVVFRLLLEKFSLIWRCHHCY